MEPITLYSHATGPNPWKVVIIFEELNIPYTTKLMNMPDLKKAPYETEINVNGRVPAIHDPNTNITLWESAAIIEYLVDKYDKAKTLTYTSDPEKYYISQWLYFQASGQGPYYGQASWFMRFHPEKLPSAIDRYKDQVKRVMYVLNKALEGKTWLVSDKCTIADLAFVSWDLKVPAMFGAELDLKAEYPNYTAWHARLLERPAVAKMMKDQGAAQAEFLAKMANGHKK